MAVRRTVEYGLPVGEGELFVPYSVLPAQGGAVHDAALAVRLRSVEGLHSSNASRLSLAFRFGPPSGNAGMQVDKSKEVSVKCQMELVRVCAGTWKPEAGGGGGVARVVLPPTLLSQAGRGIVCRLKVTAPGLFTASVLAVSAALPVPLEPGPVLLAATKGGRGLSPPLATATLSVSRLFSAEAQAVMARSLVQQLLAQLRRPADAPGACFAGATGGLPTALDALRPSRGWLPAAGLAHAFAITDGQGRSALRLAVDCKHWDCVRPLVEAACDLRALSEDLRSPLSAALEQGERPQVVLACDTRLSEEAKRTATGLSALLAELRRTGQGGSAGGRSEEAVRRWEAMVEEVARSFGPPTGQAGWPSQPALSTPATAPMQPPPPPPLLGGANLPATARLGQPPSGWSGDVFILALEHCPTGKARRTLLCLEGACAALWRVSLSSNLPALARKLAVWIGLSLNSGGGPAGPGHSPQSRRRLLDVRLDVGVEDAMLARALERGFQDERWLKVARVMVNLGAEVTAATATGRSLLLLALEHADQGHSGFRELLHSLLEKLGDDVDQWERPTVLIEENTAECPICMEPLWTSTPTAFVSFARSGGAEVAHVKCAHFFCFDCASQQYMQQQRQNVNEFQCPICRAPATEVMPLPDITVNPRLWFQFLDLEGKGWIDKKVVVQTLEAMLPIDTENLREALEESVWAQWDKAHNSRISEREFFESGGLLEWVRGHQHELQAARVRGPAPLLAEQPEAWFRHWDWAKRGRLRRGQVLRALCEAARVSSLEPKRIKQLKDGIQSIWDKHAEDDALPQDRFLAAGGAAELEALAQEVRGKGPAGSPGGGEMSLAGFPAIQPPSANQDAA